MKLENIKILYILTEISFFDIKKICIEMKNIYEKNVNIWAEDGEVVTNCPIVTYIYIKNTKNNVKIKRIPVFS